MNKINLTAINFNGDIGSSPAPSGGGLAQGYLHDGVFYKTKTVTQSGTEYSDPIESSESMIYFDLDDSKLYRYSNNVFVEVSTGETLEWLTDAEITSMFTV